MSNRPDSPALAQIQCKTMILKSRTLCGINMADTNSYTNPEMSCFLKKCLHISWATSGYVVSLSLCLVFLLVWIRHASNSITQTMFSSDAVDTHPIITSLFFTYSILISSSFSCQEKKGDAPQWFSFCSVHLIYVEQVLLWNIYAGCIKHNQDQSRKNTCLLGWLSL